MVDEIYLKLIEELRDNGRAPYEKLAEKLGVSTATISRRIDRLLKEKVIRFTTVADTKKIGYTARGLIALHVDFNKIEDVCNRLVGNPNIQLILTTFGRYDLFIMVHFKDEDTLTSFIKTELSNVIGINKVEIFYISELYKGYGVFIDKENAKHDKKSTAK